MNEEEIKEENNGLIRTKLHTRRKIRVLEKYLEQCKSFNKKYKNFAYIDTHGGTGKIIDDKTEEKVDGSVLTSAKTNPTWPCYCVEIDPERFVLLQESTKNITNINLFKGDCNEIIDEILNEIQPGERFIFCFIDPDGLIYKSGNSVKYQITWKTIEKIAEFPRTEILINFLVYGVTRESGLYHSNPEGSAAMKVENYLTMLFGSEKWKNIDAGAYKEFVRLFIDERLKKYEFKGAVLIRHEEKRGPLYYLVYGSNNKVGGKIMRHIMMKEWLDKTKTYPLTKGYYKNQEEWLDAYYPLDLFVFED